ncbi:MAG: cellulase N-terminal Ig-like domain-containing protein, partial [Bacteroidota bacterium]
MKVSICVFSFLILASTIRAQEAIYGDQFDSGALPVGEATGYQVSLENQTFRIMGTGSAPAWSAIRYDFHDGSGSEIVVNAATTPKLYLKAKGENRPNLRVDFLDNSGYVTNQNATTVTLEEDYNIYELDYTDRLLDGAFGGPCTTAPCVVDASQLLGLIFFINAPEGGYEGNVDIDWLSIGTPLEEAPPPAAYEIRYNQVSYLTNRKKIISIVSANATGEVPYQILDEEGREVRSGTSTASSFWAPSQEYVASIDFSDLNIVGTYRMITEEAEATFQINDDGYAELSKASLKYFYFNRASTSISEALGGEYARPFGHPDDEVRIHSSAATANRPVGTIISAPKGWYDAGDYNKYIVNSGIS